MLYPYFFFVLPVVNTIEGFYVKRHCRSSFRRYAAAIRHFVSSFRHSARSFRRFASSIRRCLSSFRRFRSSFRRSSQAPCTSFNTT